MNQFKTIHIISTCLLLPATIFCLDANGQMATFADPHPVKRELTVHWIETPPAIDGSLSDDVWQRLPRVTGMVDITFRHAYVVDQTLFTVAYDRENMYIGVDCRDRTPDQIKATVTERDYPFWSAKDDTLELFFDIDNTGKKLIQIVTNPLGTEWDWRKDQSGGGGSKTRWNGTWRVGAQRTATGWTAEFAIPFVDMEMGTPAAGYRLKSNLARYRRSSTADPFSSWAVVQTSFHASKYYGDWIFGSPGETTGRKDETVVNEEFVLSEQRKLRWLLKRAEHELDQISRLAPETQTGTVKELAKRIGMQRTKLQLQVQDAETLGKLVHARTAGVRFESRLGDLAWNMSLGGLAGPLDPRSVGTGQVKHMGNYWVLGGTRGIYAIVADSGALAGVWDRKTGARVIAASYDLYSLETKNDEIRSDSRFDQAQLIDQTGGSLTFRCTNPDLAGLTITKRYELVDDGPMLSKRVEVSKKVSEQTLIGVSSSTIFDPAFRTPSLYSRLMSAGAAGGSEWRPTLPASEIAGNNIQRGGFNKACGWAQMIMANRETDTGAAQYLLKLNGEYVWVPYSMTSSYWNDHGWEMSVLGTFLDEEPFSAETRYHLFDGDQMDYLHAYLRLPEVIAARAEVPASPRLAGLKGVGIGVPVINALDDTFPGGVSERISVPYNRLRSDEINIGWGLPRHSIFTQWPSQDGEKIIWVDPNTRVRKEEMSGPAREAIEAITTSFPRHLYQVYWVHTDFHPESQAYADHPEFAISTKEGSIVPATHPYSAVEADMSRAFTDYVVPRYAKMYDHLGLGLLYFDFFGGASMPDWPEGKVLQTTDYMYFDKSIRLMLEERGGFVFFNGNPGQLYTDIQYSESMASTIKMDKELGEGWWRGQHERLMHYKIMERENMVTIPIMWKDYRAGPDKGIIDNNREYTNVILALGLRPDGPHYEYGLELTREDGTVADDHMYNYAEAYYQACMEMHNTRIAQVGLQPRYWSDPGGLVEAYVLRKGPGYFITAISHRKEPGDINVSMDVEKLAFKPGQRLFRWHYTRRDDEKVSRLIGPDTSPDWDRLFTDIACRSGLLGDDQRLTVTFEDADVNYTCIATLTQVPGVYMEKEGIETQFRVPNVLRCTLSGDLDEKERQVTLTANAVTPARVAAWCPEKWSKPQVEVNGKAQPNPHYTEYGSERFVIVPVDKGESRIVVRGG